MVYSIYAFRKEYNDNMITYGRALGFGVLTALLIGIILGVYTIIYIQYINTDFIALTKQNIEEKLLQKGFSADIIDRATERVDRMNNPGSWCLPGASSRRSLSDLLSVSLLQYLSKKNLRNLLPMLFKIDDYGCIDCHSPL